MQLFFNNSATNGGAIYMNHAIRSKTSLHWCNRASDQAGTLLVEPHSIALENVLIISLCEFLGNEAKDGGAIKIREESSRK